VHIQDRLLDKDLSATHGVSGNQRLNVQL